MPDPTDFAGIPNRDATASIRGYVYQIYQSVWAWILLGEDDVLILEGAEDFDVHVGPPSISSCKSTNLMARDIPDADYAYDTAATLLKQFEAGFVWDCRVVPQMGAHPHVRM